MELIKGNGIKIFYKNFTLPLITNLLALHIAMKTELKCIFNKYIYQGRQIYTILLFIKDE